jgi:hypothetical protein
MINMPYCRKTRNVLSRLMLQRNSVVIKVAIRPQESPRERDRGRWLGAGTGNGARVFGRGYSRRDA